MVSKEALIFQNRIKSFDEDLEMMDVLKVALSHNANGHPARPAVP